MFSTHMFPSSGMMERDFKGIPSIKEVLCLGHGVNPELKLMSINMYTNSEQSLLATLNVFTNTCMTYTAYSSCFVDNTGGHESKVKVLVTDLEEGESRRFGCKLTVMDTKGNAGDLKRSFVVTRSKYNKHQG